MASVAFHRLMPVAAAVAVLACASPKNSEFSGVGFATLVGTVLVEESRPYVGTASFSCGILSPSGYQSVFETSGSGAFSVNLSIVHNQSLLEANGYRAHCAFATHSASAPPVRDTLIVRYYPTRNQVVPDTVVIMR